MNAHQFILSHLLPITAGIAVLWLVYRLLFRNSNRVKFNRFFLLTAMLFALALPFIGMQMGQSAPQVATLKQSLFGGATMLNEIIVTPDGQPVLPEVMVTTSTATSRFSLWQVIGGIYLIGVGVMLLLFLFKIGKLVALILRSPKEKREGYTAVFTGREQGSFSFFRYAFFPNESVSPDIVRHEASHIGHRHSWDVLFVEVMMVLQWFNPFIYLYKKELQSLHEYQADRDVVATGVDKRNYMMLILQQCTAVDFSGIGNNFSLILTKKRIKMITKNEKAKGLWWRLLATLPVLAILLVANTKVTAQEKKAENQPFTIEIAGSFEIYDDDGFPIQLKDTVIYNEDGSYVKYVTSDDIDPETGEPRQKMTITTHKIDGTPADYMNLHWEINGNVARYTAENFSISTDESLLILLEGLSSLADKSKNDSIFQAVEQMPEFPGGLDELMKFVAGNVKYPEEAKDKNIEGRVFVSFVIEKDGSVNEVKVLRGIGGGCDEEAVRVISSLPKWKPGMHKGEPVRVSYQMPINFKLNDESKQPVDKSGESKVDMQPDKNGVYQIVEEMPRFPGGEKALLDYVSKNIVYPEAAKDKEIQGRVFVGFVVEKDGSIGEVKLLRGISKECDEEALRVIKSMPKWQPGKMKGEPVRVSYQIPIFFKLDNDTKKSNSLVGSVWEGTGTGTKDGVTYTWHSIMQFTSEKEGLFIEKLTSQKKNSEPVVEFENVAMDFEYAFDGKKTGAVTPKNGDRTYMDELPPEGFILSDDGKTIILNFYTATDDTGIKFVTYTRR